MSGITRRGILVTGATATTLASAPAALAGGAPTQSSPTMGPSRRDRLLLDQDWRFALGHAQDPAKDFGFGLDQRTFAKAGTKVAAAADAAFDDGGWTAIRLPHDWAVELPFAETRNLDPKLEEDPRAAHGFKPLGREYPATSVGWYRKRFAIPASDQGRRLSIEFDGVFRDCLVLFNGYIVHRNEGGYAPFRVDVTDFVAWGGDNVLALRVDASLGEGWFYEGAGVYRHVWLVKTDPLHVPQWGVFVRPVASGGGAALTVTTEIANEGDVARAAQLVSTVLDRDGRPVASDRKPIRIAPWDKGAFDQAMRIDRAALWSVETPNLYSLVTEVRAGDAVIDRIVTPFGVRTARFDPEAGFFLNGKPVKLLGTCNHQDHAGVGSALPDRLHAFRIEKLKEMGSNAYRAAHNPPAPELLDACDRLGMLVIDETRRMSSDPAAMDQLERLIRRDRNHPSVILWSIGNEEQIQQGTERGAAIARTMRRTVDRLDGTRPVTAAVDSGFGEGVSKVVDVLGFNYRTDQMEAYHRRFPRQPILGSETASTVATRGAYVRDDARHVLPAYDREHPWWASTAEAWWTIAAERPYIAGGFIWTGFDYRGEPTPFNQWPSVSSYFGVMDSCGFPKDNYHYYRAWWRPEPALHLFPHWNWEGRDGAPIEVWCHSNLDRVELFLNGRSQGARDVPRNRHVAWNVPYAPGALTARGFKDGRVAMTVERVTTGPPAGVVLTPDRTRLAADGEDVCVVTASVVDALGRTVPTANDALTFAVSGEAALIGDGNGDPVSHEADKAPRRRAFNGLACAILQSTPRAGPVLLTASGAGLRPGRLRLNTSESIRRPWL
jgi:beta-galactosidase